MRSIASGLVLFSLAAPAAAQQDHAQHAPPAADDAAQQSVLPEGWRMRLDRANANPAEVRFTTMDPGWHVTTGPAAIFYRAESTASGAFRAQAAIHLMKPSEHAEAYGFFIGGRNLDQDDQDYLYFLVRQDGKYLIKHRAGSETHTIVDWTDHPAVVKGSTEGSVKNVLAIDAGPSELAFYVNGQEVERLERPAYANTDGVVGLRVNHRLDVHIESLTVEPQG
ncbi:MAG: hypothetical protein ACRELD_05220 [Longimicrobiales bacterium]